MQLIELMARQWAKTDYTIYQSRFEDEGTLEAFWRANHAEYMGKAEGMLGVIKADHAVVPRATIEGCRNRGVSGANYMDMIEAGEK